MPYFRGFLKEGNELCTILFVRENRFTLPAVVHYMIPCIRVFYSQRPGHTWIYRTNRY